ncbi:hypothetical protein FXW26_05395 [Candidatus Liberibacter asiaticus]|nr:hypothetical protein FXW26_05395 [Candidatus Liberibacter asiaticus]
MAIPTAMPDVPLAKRFGNLLGKTTGSESSSLYVSRKSTASSSTP